MRRGLILQISWTKIILIGKDRKWTWNKQHKHFLLQQLQHYNFYNRKSNTKKFINCTDTIVFVRNVDRLFDFWNFRHSASSGFKSPIQLTNVEKKKAVILEICLLLLKDPDIYSLSQHRRRTFIIGFVSLAKSILSIAEELLFRYDNRYKYLLTYKLSQDHLEMFFFMC